MALKEDWINIYRKSAKTEHKICPNIFGKLSLFPFLVIVVELLFT